MRHSTVWRTLALPLLLFVSAAATAQPANNNLANARVVGALPYSNTQTNVGATRQAGEASASCAFDGLDGNQSIWYRYTPAASGPVLFGAAGFDTVLAVYTGTAFPLTEVACADYSIDETVTATLTAGTRYYIRVNGYNSETGTATVTASTPPAAPANDNLAAAAVIATNSTVMATNVSATLETGEAEDSCGGGAGASVWWRYTAQAAGAVTFSTVGSDFDTVLSVHTGATPPVHPLTEVGCDDQGAGNQSVISNLPVTPGTVYYVRVGGYSREIGDIVLSLTSSAIVSQTLANGRGYRILAAPVAGMTVGTLADINLVQGVVGQYPGGTNPVAPNVFLSYTGTGGYQGSGYVPATNVTNPLVPGLGFFWLLYDIDLVPPSDASNGTGTSRSYVLATRPLVATGTELLVNTTVSFAGSTTNRFRLGGNPFATAMTAEGVMASVPIQNSLQLYGPNGSGVFTYTAVPRTAATTLSTWQGFFVEQTETSAAAVTVTYDASKRVAGNETIVGRSTAASALALTLSGQTADGVAVADEAASVVVTDDATAGWDPDDASKFIPPGSPYALIAPVGEMDGRPNRQAVLSLPSPDAVVTVAFTATHAGTYTVSAASLGLPQATAARLRDVVTGAVTDLADGAHTFTSGPTDWTDRFVLDVTTGAVVANDPGAPAEFALAAPTPNPTSSASTIAFDVPAASNVTVMVYDLLGRRVAVLAQGQRAAGRHTARIEAGTFAPGVYVVRMTAAVGGGAGSFSAMRRVTVVR